MSAYDPGALCNAAAQILVHSAPQTATKIAMKCAGFKSVDEEYKVYRKRIERQRNKLMSLPSLVLINEGSVESNSSTSTLSCSETEVGDSVVGLFRIFMISQYGNTPSICFYSR